MGEERAFITKLRDAIFVVVLVVVVAAYVARHQWRGQIRNLRGYVQAQVAIALARNGVGRGDETNS